MMAGLQLGLLPARTLDESIEIFLDLQREYSSLKAGEIHLDGCQYQASCWPWDTERSFQALRSSVDKMGVHLPFTDLHPLSANPLVKQLSQDILQQSLVFAADIDSDYVVFHARSNHCDHRIPTPQLQPWPEIILKLAYEASRLGLTFCLENADDLRMPDMVQHILRQDAEHIHLCLDIGHLFERYDPASKWVKYACRINDKLLGNPMLCKSGLPAAFWNNWIDAFDFFSGHIECVHLHNHNGIEAHQPLQQGRLNLRSIRSIKETMASIPVIIEVDYRRHDVASIKKDLDYAEVILNG